LGRRATGDTLGAGTAGGRPGAEAGTADAAAGPTRTRPAKAETAARTADAAETPGGRGPPGEQREPGREQTNGNQHRKARNQRQHNAPPTGNQPATPQPDKPPPQHGKPPPQSRPARRAASRGLDGGGIIRRVWGGGNIRTAARGARAERIGGRWGSGRIPTSRGRLRSLGNTLPASGSQEAAEPLAPPRRPHVG